MTATTPSQSDLQQMTSAILYVKNMAGPPGGNRTVEFLAAELATIGWDRINWNDLSTSERAILRFAWEFSLRTDCPLMLRPGD